MYACDFGDFMSVCMSVYTHMCEIVCTLTGALHLLILADFCQTVRMLQLSRRRKQQLLSSVLDIFHTRKCINHFILNVIKVQKRQPRSLLVSVTLKLIHACMLSCFHCV